MNERIKELEKQAWEFVDKTWNWANANNPSQATLFKAKFAELIAYECIDLALGSSHREDDMGAIIANKIRKHFGVEE